MLKERATIDYMVYIIDAVNTIGRATGQQVITELSKSEGNSPTYIRKVITRLTGQRLLTNFDGLMLTKAYDDYTLDDILMATGDDTLKTSPATRAEDLLKEAAKQIKLKDLL